MSDDLVYAFQPCSIDPPQHVADDWGDLVALNGALVPADQCDRCGNSVYRVTPISAFGLRGPGFFAVCTVDPDDEVSASFGGCGQQYPIRLLPAAEVCF